MNFWNYFDLKSNLKIQVMLELQKLVIQNLAANRKVFVKELIKSIKWLNTNEVAELEHWVKENFWKTHKSEIEQVFDQKYNFV